jgi:peptidoglycan/LPS O-acetylase OafA/YrhL
MSDVPLHRNNKRDNNFGFLRLLFATLVIVAHSPVMVDGNKSREILTKIFDNTMTFGGLGVDGFFLISGYLITRSFVQSKSTTSYFIHRGLRIVPGYLVCFWICVLVIAPFVSAENPVLSAQVMKLQLLRAFLILPPDVPGAFQGLPFPTLNGSMWTLAYEVRCYIATAFLGLLGAYKPRFRLYFLGGVVILMLLNATGAMRGFHSLSSSLFGTPEWDVQFTACYGVGAVYYLFRDRVRLTSVGALIAATLLFVLLFSRDLGETAIMILGGYLIFWVAFKVRVLRISRIINSVDISYGLYLYAWPIQSLIIWNNRTINPFVLCGVTLMIAGLLAYVSWTLIEKPSTQFVRRRRSVLRSPWTS